MVPYENLISENDQYQSRTASNFCNFVAKWVGDVKNVQSSGIHITDDLHKTIGQKFLVIKHNHGLNPNDWNLVMQDPHQHAG